MSGKRRLVAMAPAMAIGIVLGAAGMAAANFFTFVQGTGTDITRVKTRAGEGQFPVTDTTSGDGPVFADLPNAVHRLVLSEETLVVARFQAEALCTGSGGCKAKIEVRDNSAGDAFVANMEPDFISAWDVAGADSDEVQGVERSITLPPGDYDFQVVVGADDAGADVTFLVSDWHFTIERIV